MSSTLEVQKVNGFVLKAQLLLAFSISSCQQHLGLRHISILFCVLSQPYEETLEVCDIEDRNAVAKRVQFLARKSSLRECKAHKNIRRKPSARTITFIRAKRCRLQANAYAIENLIYFYTLQQTCETSAQFQVFCS